MCGTAFCVAQLLAVVVSLIDRYNVLYMCGGMFKCSGVRPIYVYICVRITSGIVVWFVNCETRARASVVFEVSVKIAAYVRSAFILQRNKTSIRCR